MDRPPMLRIAESRTIYYIRMSSEKYSKFQQILGCLINSLPIFYWSIILVIYSVISKKGWFVFPNVFHWQLLYDQHNQSFLFLIFLPAKQVFLVASHFSLNDLFFILVGLIAHLSFSFIDKRIVICSSIYLFC